MSFRSFVQELEKKKALISVEKPVSKRLEAAGLIHNAGACPVLFKKIKESSFAVAGNVFASKELIARDFKCKTSELVPKMIKAIENPSTPKEVEKGSCLEESTENVDLDSLPILFHCEKDGGNYVTSGVVVAKDKDYGQNVSFHRCMQLDKKRFSVRILERHLHEFIEKNGELDVALCIGCSSQVLLAGAVSTKIGINELEIANSLREFEVTETKNNLLVPADSEFVLEGTITNELAEEGPFVDLTGTYDIVRQQRIFEVKRVNQRKNAIWHALLPGGLEHKILMGMPKEPIIFQEVNSTVKCLDVNINPGGCSWLHAIVKIKKENPDDGKKAIEAAFSGHKSLKHAFVVDEDINIYDPEEVEWAFATRFQGSKDIMVKERQKGSSLDPSADPTTRETTKVGFDLTIPSDKKKEDFLKVKFQDFKIKDFLEGEK